MKDKKIKKIKWIDYILKGIIIFIVTYGAFTPSYGFADVGTIFMLIYIILGIYYLVKLSKTLFAKKSKNKENWLWYLIILIIIFIPMREAIQSNSIKEIKDFTIKLHEDCNLKKKCPEVKNLPFTNGRFLSLKFTDTGFEISHWHMETVHEFKGGIGQDLTFSYSWADHFDKKESIYKYDNKEWTKINDGWFN